MEIVDLGKIFKCKIRHDNSFINPSWFLDKVEVVDQVDKETYVFYCERWLAKNKDDGKIERSLYVRVSFGTVAWKLNIFCRLEGSFKSHANASSIV